MLCAAVHQRKFWKLAIFRPAPDQRQPPHKANVASDRIACGLRKRNFCNVLLFGVFQAIFGGAMKLDLLAIAAHPDDVELTCGGTLLKATDQGYQTGILDLTAGEMGTRGTPETRLKESAKAARILRVAHRENLRLPDAHLEVTNQTKLAVAQRIRALKPHTVILPYWEGRHPDHYTAARLGYEGCFLAGLKQLPIEGEAFRPFKILYSTVYYRDVR